MTAAAFVWSLWPGATPLHVVDVGANPIEGDAPYAALMQAGYARVTGFEPQADALAALNRAKSAAETYLPHALGDGGAARLHVYKHSGFTSLFPIDQAVSRLVGFHRSTVPVTEVEVATVRLDDLAEVGPIDYLKIDVQGAENAVISAGADRLAQAVLVQTEVRFLPLYAGEPTFATLDTTLRSQGFVFHDFAHLKRVALRSAHHGTLRPRTNRQVIDGDAFYIRDITQPGQMTDLQLFRLALLGAAVMDSPNLTVFCLDMLAERGRVAGDAAAGFLTRLPEAAKRVTADA
jgi:FkbM family methyltransferase